MLQIEIVDESCDDGEAHIFVVPVDVDKKDVMTAISIFFPTASAIYMFVISSN